MTPMTPDPKPTPATDGMVDAWKELAVNKWQEFIPVEVINRLIARIEQQREKIASLEERDAAACPLCKGTTLRVVCPYGLGYSWVECQADCCTWTGRPSDSALIASAIAEWRREEKGGE